MSPTSPDTMGSSLPVFILESDGALSSYPTQVTAGVRMGTRRACVFVHMA